MNNSKIGNIQITAMIITVMISHIILNMPTHLIATSGSATILNLIYVFIIALAIFYFACKIFEMFPGKDIIDICGFAFGNTCKNILSIAVCVYFLTISGFVIRTFAESLTIIYFENIDIKIVIMTFVVITAIMNILGLKSISRVSLITLPIILIAFIFIFISSSSNFVPQRALPPLGYGAYNTFVSGISNIFAFASIFIAPFLLPYIKNPKDFKKIGFSSLLIYFVYLLLGIIALLFLIPSITSISNTLSIYILSRRVNFGNFIQRIDSLFILIWVMSIFNYLAITMHFTLESFNKISKVDKKTAISFFSIILFIICLLPQNIADISFFESTIYKYVSIIFVFFISMFILVYAYFKKKKEKKGVPDAEQDY